MRFWWRHKETGPLRNKASAHPPTPISAFRCCQLPEYMNSLPELKPLKRITLTTPWSWSGDKIRFFSGCNFNDDASSGRMLFKRVSRGTKIWHPGPNKPACLGPVPFPQRRSKGAERKGVSKVSLELRANKNETILFWDLINFYIQSYTAQLFIAYD